jgi:dihydrolipoamide dehydrogenase
MQKFDLVVLGSGPGGYRAAVLGALRGLKVAVVEKGTWGGTCLNRGCVPKKAWHHSAQLIAASREFDRRGITGHLSGNLDGAWAHQRTLVDRVRTSYTDYLDRLGVRRVAAAARFADAHTIDAGGQRLSAANVVIATGSHPLMPPNLAGGGDKVLTTDDLFDRPPPPGRRVAVIGSGVIGTEFAFILSMLGREVIWLMQSEPLGHGAYSAPARQALRGALRDVGIVARTHSRVRAATRSGAQVTLELPDGSRESVDWALLGAGREPHTAGLNLAAAGVDCHDTGFVRVDSCQRTAMAGIYAIGDVANPAMTSNHALADAAVAVNDIIQPGSRCSDASAVPQVVYSALELARIGLSEDAAEERGYEPATGFAAFEANPAALAEGEARGFVRVVSDLDDGGLLGAEIVGPGAGELVQLVGCEFGDEHALARLAGMAYNHPARGEEILNAVETLAARWGLGARVFAGSRRPRKFAE